MEPKKLQRTSQPEEYQKTRILDGIKGFFLRMLGPKKSAPNVFRLVDLPRELIDMILDMAISNETPQHSTSITLSSAYSELASYDALSSNFFVRFPFVLPAVPAVFHLNHSVRAKLLRRHSRYILELAIPGCNEGIRPWIYRHGCNNELRLTMPTRLSSFHIALLMRCISPQLAVQKALKVVTIEKHFCCRWVQVVWLLEMSIVDEGEEKDAIVAGSRIGPPRTGERMRWKIVSFSA
ncbi:hypothetical protein P171DRAFT_269389 [Karstenula rhodostoma CBS 690.94]|uniref:Uncharacterized protein n=1 Tax=Karstenula rhodostoma CBS 690.94 TaxID=1392251 RepID=A0A9P4PMI7_9PLEO|nr:hypothetical protein P171DRAFT_269389 [Karstenula rhodostoma CBS 690.94]